MKAKHPDKKITNIDTKPNYQVVHTFDNDPKKTLTHHVYGKDMIHAGEVAKTQISDNGRKHLTGTKFTSIDGVVTMRNK